MPNQISNPFRPGAGHMPPHLAGRKGETDEFMRLLQQDVVFENLVLTGLRGVGKTVLLETFKPLAIKSGWLWVGADLSEATSLTEDRIAVRLMADLAVITSSMTVDSQVIQQLGFDRNAVEVDVKLDFNQMVEIYELTPGLASDKLKAVLEVVWSVLKDQNAHGLIFAYDEAQIMSDHAEKDQYPLSLMLDVFQSIQRKEIPFMLVLTGLPTLFPKLVEARTFSERMFRIVFLDRLSREESREAIIKPIDFAECPVRITDESVDLIVEEAGGYPYFIQFICKEVYDVFLSRPDESTVVPVREITRKLDTDFFSGRWAKATDRERDLLTVIASLESCDKEFTVQEIAQKSKEQLEKGFSPSQISQMLSKLGDAGLVYKNRHGRYAFAVPLLGQFILRQTD
jgi:DNA-binding transcriptional ArsR family regulator